MTTLQRNPESDSENFGPYEVYERLGVGGMATVHRAKERGIAGFERIVALKRLLPHLAEDEQFVRSFVREAKLAALLNHANIVQLYELGRVGHAYFISMEYIQGRDIRKLLRQARRVTGPAPIEVIVSLLMQVCDALDYAHTRRNDDGTALGLIHRDVSPSNLIINESGHVKVIDFGIAKAQTEQMHTQTGRIKGKMAYMAPEAIRGLVLDARSDLFSVGVLAHELLTARPLFATKNDYQTLQRVQNAELIPPSHYNPDCPPDLDEIVLKALCRDRDQRWSGADEIRDALAGVKVRHKLSANPRTVAEWMDWAFALEAPLGQGSGSISTVSSVSSSISGSHRFDRSSVMTPSTRSSSAAVPPLETDDEILEIAWEGRSQLGPVLLDEVPDVSDRAVPRAYVASGNTPAPRLSDGVVAAAAEASKSGGTLIAYVPPPPTRERTSETTPTDWASGTRPPTNPMLAIAATRRATTTGVTDVPEQSEPSDGVPVASKELSGEREAVESTMHVVAASARPSTPAPAVSASPIAAKRKPPERLRELSDPPRRSRAVTEFGAAIVEREKSNTLRTVAIVAGVVAVIAGSYLLTQSGRNAKKVATKAAKGATVPAEATEPTRGQLRFVLEPSDAIISIKGRGEYAGTGKKVRLLAGAYSVEVRRDGYKSWKATIDLEAGENQTVRVALAPEGSSETSTGTPTRDSSSRRATHSARRDRERDRERKRRRNAARIVRNSDEVVDVPAGNDEVGSVSVSDTAATITPNITPELAPKLVAPAAPQPAPRPSGPVLVPPHKIKRLSGTVPQLRRLKGEELPERVNAKLCIDTSGSVTSVQLITSVPERMQRTLDSALRSWRYQPYRSAGSARAACFVQSFKLR